MALDILGITDAYMSHAMASGWFETVNGHEPKNPPSTGGLTAAVWSDDVIPVGSASGLDSVTAVLVMKLRVYSSAVQEPPDAIDPNMIAAVDALCAAYVGDFTLGGLVRHVDIFGMYGQALRVKAGYLQADGMPFRVMDITLPAVINDLWSESA